MQSLSIAWRETNTTHVDQPEQEQMCVSEILHPFYTSNLKKKTVRTVTVFGKAFSSFRGPSP